MDKLVLLEIVWPTAQRFPTPHFIVCLVLFAPVGGKEALAEGLSLIGTLDNILVLFERALFVPVGVKGLRRTLYESHHKTLSVIARSIANWFKGHEGRAERIRRVLAQAVSCDRCML